MRLLKFYAKDCEPCKNLTNMLDLPEFSDFKVINIDVYSELGYDIVMQRGLERVPTLIKVCDDGAETSIVGLPTLNQLAAFLGILKTATKD
jgi:hypothetical protein